ncbi:MAG: beta-L-arabinofuranosidase domain-containing protein, partial [Candidatus Helarchaeales archaeon]
MDDGKLKKSNTCSWSVPHPGQANSLPNRSAFKNDTDLIRDGDILHSTQQVKVEPIPFHLVKINDDFWSPLQDITIRKAIPHQLEKLEETQCINNFKIIAGLNKGFRRLFFHSDSDLYKWIEAASRAVHLTGDPDLQKKLDEIVEIVEAACEP